MGDFLKIDDVLSHLKIKGNEKAAEFGCGSADFSLTLAKRLPKGMVYALDVQEERLSALAHKLSHGDIKNVSAVLTDLEAPNGSGLKDNSLNMVLIPNLLFYAKEKSVIIAEAKRVLKNGGQMLLVDRLKKDIFAPKAELVDVGKIKEAIGNFGFVPKKEFSAGDYHFALLFTKKADKVSTS